MSGRIIIIGGSGSIGSSIAKEVISEGFEPYLVGRNFASLDKVSKDLNCSFGVADVTKSEELKKELEKCGENIHGLAYCAGSIDLKSLSAAHENDYLESFKVNTLGAQPSKNFYQRLFEKERKRERFHYASRRSLWKKDI